MKLGVEQRIEIDFGIAALPAWLNPTSNYRRVTGFEPVNGDLGLITYFYGSTKTGTDK
jgi:hypothetical protein